jgi:hypothetical protein
MQRRRSSTVTPRARPPRVWLGLAIATVIASGGVFTAVASAARIPIPHFDGGDARLLLQNADRFPLTPPQGASAARLRTELDDAGASLRSRLQPQAVATEASEQSAIETRFADCADQAYDGAVQDVVTAVENGEEPDFDSFMYARARNCVGAAFPSVPVESIATAAAVMTAHADEAAQPAFEQAATPVDEPTDSGEVFDDPPPDESGGGLATWLLIGGVVVGLGVLATVLNGRRPG